MKLTVLNWFWNWLLGMLARGMEVLFRLLLLCTPLGIYLLIIQSRNKVSSVSSLTAYTKPESVWQHVFPGFILVSINKNDLRTHINLINTEFQNFIGRNKYTLSFLLAASLVVMMVLMYVK